MRIIAVDDEPLGLELLALSIKKAAPEAEVVSFGAPQEVLDYLKDNDADVLFTDIQMPGMLGTQLAKKAKALKPGISIIFATGYDSYMGDAFSLHASGYVLKPITASKIERELENLEELRSAYKIKAEQENKKIRLQCFGNFEIFVNEKAVRFKYDKTKEVLAYMVSRRGTLCSSGEIIANVWEDDVSHESYLRGLRKDLVDSLKAIGAADMIVTQRGKMGIDANLVSCDYYDYLQGDPAAINSYQGEFMAQYSWGELVNAELLNI